MHWEVSLVAKPGVVAFQKIGTHPVVDPWDFQLACGLGRASNQ